MDTGHSRRDLGLMHQAARMYYLDDVNQAGIAERLSVSRPTVSRLLTEARKIGIVRITVHDPGSAAIEANPAAVAAALGLERVWLAPWRGGLGDTLGTSVGHALREAGLEPGDALLVSSGRTLYELSKTELPAMPGVDICPTVGGVTEPEAWHQTNEITRSVAERMGARPHFLFAPAMPSRAIRASLDEDPDFQRVTRMWSGAKAALVGVGAPPMSRESISTSVPLDDKGLRAAIGDVCLNFFRSDGREIAFPGSDRMVRISPQQLQAVPRTIAVAVGREKVGSLLAGARAGLFNRLVTDIPTAELLLAAVEAQKVD